MADFNGALKQVEGEKVHHFPMQTAQGPGVLNVPHGKMSRCVCGCDKFNKVFNCGWVKTDELCAPPLWLEAPLFVCCSCGTELGMDSPKVEDAKISEGG